MKTNVPNRTLAILAIVALALGFVVALVLLLIRLSGILPILAASVLLAYAVAPAVSLLRRRLPVVLAIAVTYVGLLAIVAGLLLLVVPPIVTETQQLLASIPAVADSAQRAVVTNGILERLPASIRSGLDAIPAQIARLLGELMLRIAQSGLGLLASVAAVAVALIVVPVLSAYLLFDGADLKRAALGFVPAQHRAKALAVMDDLSDVLGAFIRGQIIDGIIVGTLIGTMLAANQVPYAILIGTIAAFLNFVPYLSILTVIPSVLLTVACNGWQNALLVAFLYAVIQQIDGNFIEPYVMRANVRLKPTLLIVSIVVMTALFGAFGTFVAVPVAAMLRVVKLHFAPAPSPETLIADREAASPLRRFNLP